MLSLGLSLTVADLWTALRRGRLLLAVAVVNLLVLPAAAWGIATALPIDADRVPGLVLVAIGAGGAAGLKAVQLSGRGSLALAVSLVVFLQLADIVTVPLWARQIVTDATVSRTGIVVSLLALVLAPLTAGLVLRARAPRVANAWVPRLTTLSTLTLAVALIAGTVANYDEIRRLLPTWVPVAAAATVGLAAALGWSVAGRDRRDRTSAAFVSASRFATLGLVIIITQLGSDPRYLGPALVAALLNLALLLCGGLVLGRIRVPTLARR